MTPAQIIAVIRDLIILIALGALIYLLISYGKDLVKVADMAAVQKQLSQNASTEAQWRKEAQDAQTTLYTDMAVLRARIDAQRAPIIVRNAPSACPVPTPTAAPSSPSAGPRATDAGPGNSFDARPAINAFEIKYEQSLAECRAALASWPQ